MTRFATLDLFSGIGGFSLGLEQTGGYETVAFCEPDHFCRGVLKRHWPEVPRFADVRSLSSDGGASLEYEHKGQKIVIPLDRRIDCICGGFPCQDLSTAGKGQGLSGERSGLWREFHRLIKEIKPRYAFIENVAALRSRGLEEVLRALASIGYDAEWHCIPASAVGAPHRRDRIWIAAYPRVRESLRVPEVQWQRIPEVGYCGSTVAYPASEPKIRPTITRQECSPWNTEPEVGRVVDGVPYRVVRPYLRSLGNSLIPQIARAIGEAVLRAEASV